MSDLRQIITISGAPASGKSTLEAGLVWCFEGGKVRTITTRSPRPGESARAYEFCAPEELNVREDLLWRVEVHNGVYAVAASGFIEAARETGGTALLAVTPAGHNLATSHFGSGGVRFVRMHLTYPGESVLRDRLLCRGDDLEQIARRLQDAHTFEKEVMSIEDVHHIAPHNRYVMLARALSIIRVS